MLRHCVLISMFVIGAATTAGAADMSPWRTAQNQAQAQDCQCSWVQASQPGQTAQNQSGCLPQSRCEQLKGTCGGPCKGP
jgi:hypothetical protein